VPVLPTSDAPPEIARQRILQRRHKRISIRLEEVFWAQLEACAREENIRLADLVFSLVEEREGENRSSLLRTYCVDWLRKRLFQARLAASQIDLQSILVACPTPCVVITPQRALAAQNPAFKTQIVNRLLNKQPPDPDRNAVIRVSLREPFQTIVNRLHASKVGSLESEIAVSSGGESVTYSGNFCLLNRRPVEASPLLCFLREAPDAPTPGAALP
jgi:predicted DNA-binding ribbon-helix-helix protein